MEGLLHQAGGALVPVVDRVLQQAALGVQQAKVHAPGVKGQAVHRAGLLGAQADVCQQVLKVPAEMAVLVPGVVLKAVDLLVEELPVFIGA